MFVKCAFPKCITILFIAVFLATSCTASNAFVKKESFKIEKYTLPYFTWMDPYYADHGEKRFFDIDSLMTDFSLTRLEAVEVQNRYRDKMYDLYNDNNCNELKKTLTPNSLPYKIECVSMELRESVFLESIAYVNKNGGESGWNRKKLNQSKFVVVFDLDETLFSQDRSDGALSLSPGWEKAIIKVKKNGGAVVLFTAKPDYMLSIIMHKWKINIDGTRKLVSEVVDGVFSNNHLIKSKTAGVLLLGTKDLRIVDPTLQKVIIIDDNPNRISQVKNLRYVRKWNPVKDDDSRNYSIKYHKKFYEKRLLQAVSEIIDSESWATTNHASIVDGFLPYSYMARPVTQELADVVFNGNWMKTVDYIRKNPKIIDKKY